MDERTTPSVKNARSEDTSTSSNGLNSEGNPSQSLQKDNVTAVTVPKASQPTREAPKGDLTQDLRPVQENSEGTTPQTADYGNTRSYVSVKLATVEAVPMNTEGSGMSPETSNVDLFVTAAPEAEDGSGMDPEVTTSTGLTPIPNSILEASESGNIQEKKNSNTETKAEGILSSTRHHIITESSHSTRSDYSET